MQSNVDITCNNRKVPSEQIDSWRVDSTEDMQDMAILHLLADGPGTYNIGQPVEVKASGTHVVFRGRIVGVAPNLKAGGTRGVVLRCMGGRPPPAAQSQDIGAIPVQHIKAASISPRLVPFPGIKTNLHSARVSVHDNGGYNGIHYTVGQSASVTFQNPKLLFAGKITQVIRECSHGAMKIDLSMRGTVSPAAGR